MPTATTKWFNHNKGYGFLAPEGGGEDIFVHVSALDDGGIGSLAPGDRVSFEIGADKKSGRPKAINLKLLDEETA